MTTDQLQQLAHEHTCNMMDDDRLMVQDVTDAYEAGFRKALALVANTQKYHLLEDLIPEGPTQW